MPPPVVTDGRIASPDRKRTRLNSSHPSISYAVFCLKKNKRAQARRHGIQNTTQKKTAHTLEISRRRRASGRRRAADTDVGLMLEEPQGFFFLMIRRPPRSTLFPTRRSSDLVKDRAAGHVVVDDAIREPVERVALPTG